MPLLLLILLLSACAANQSAFPVAPPFSPVLDAPVTVGQPGYVGELERAPRSPHKRVLPQTPETRKEAGIWAANAPSQTEPVLLGVRLPVPPDAPQLAR